MNSDRSTREQNSRRIFATTKSVDNFCENVEKRRLQAKVELERTAPEEIEQNRSVRIESKSIGEEKQTVRHEVEFQRGSFGTIEKTNLTVDLFVEQDRHDSTVNLGSLQRSKFENEINEFYIEDKRRENNFT